MAHERRSQPIIRLPAALRDQIEAQASGGDRRPGRHGVSRRDVRKGHRQAKKQRRAVHFSSELYHSARPALKRPAEHAVEEERVPKKRKLYNERVGAPVPATKAQAEPKKTDASSKRMAISNSVSKGPSALAKLAARLDGKPLREKFKQPKVALPRAAAEIAEDKRIARFERLIGDVDRKGGPGAGEDDGFDDLLTFVDGIGASSGVTNEATDSMSEESEDEEGAELDGGSHILSEEVESQEDMSGEDDDEEDDEAQEDGDDLDHFSGFEDEDEDVELSGSSSSRPTVGRERGADSVTTKSAVTSPTPGASYVPPHLRSQQPPAKAVEGEDANISKDVAEITKLRRQCQGLLNRLSEQNISGILGEIEALYADNRRNDVTTTLTSLTLDTISSRSNLLDSFVILHAALLASLTKITGIEFGAYFLHTLVMSYRTHYEALQSAEDAADIPGERGKECTNLIVLLSELYNFQVVSCILIYDIVRDLLAGPLNEMNVELLLKLLKSSGPQLHHDDPSALNDIVAIVQSKLIEQESSSLSSRTRFMVETLTNLKNNKSKAVQNQAVATEATNKMKKFIAGLGKTRHLRAHDPLRVTLVDLVSSEHKGKWWLVGSAWAGDPLDGRAAQESAEKPLQTSENVLMKLARKQGMNTDVRRNIFVVLLSSEDYVDAQERLDQLNLAEIQQREIIRVLVHCCGTEKNYNPFYALVGQRLCQTSHSHKVTLQFCLWDFLRELGETEVGGAEIIKSAREDNALAFDATPMSSSRLSNLAKAYAWWIAKGASSLTIFRPVNFTSLQPRTVRFFQTFFVYLFISTQSRLPLVDVIKQSQLIKSRDRVSLEQVLMKAVGNAALAKGILYFLSRSRPDSESYPEAVAETVDWACDVAKETLRTGMDLAATLS